MASLQAGVRPYRGEMCKAGLHPWEPDNIYTYPDGAQKCRECARAKDRLRNERDREKRKAQQRARYARIPPDVKRRARILRSHGITQETYDGLLEEQGGRCATCGTTQPGGKWNTYFHVDHDHACCPGKLSCGRCIRGLLCGSCNMALGNVRDDPKVLLSLAAYLTQGGDD